MPVFPLLLLLLLTLGCVAAKVVSEGYHDSTDECEFTLGDRAFNMCPAFAISSSWIKAHGHDGLYSDFEISTDEHAYNMFTQNFYSTEQMRTAEVVWICDKSGLDTSSDPQPIGINSGVHSFIWATPHACGHSILTHAQDADGNSGESKDAEEEAPISDLDPVPISDRRHYTIVTILLLTGAAIMGIAYLVIRPPATLQHLTSHLPYLKLPTLHPFQRRLGASFRTGEGNLVKWAAADMLGGDEEEGDQFINGVDLENGEEIPLTPSPTKHGRGLFGTRYGAVSV